MNPISIIEEAKKYLSPEEYHVLRRTVLKLIEEIQKNMPSHDAVQKILFDIQSYLKDNLEK